MDQWDDAKLALCCYNFFILFIGVLWSRVRLGGLAGKEHIQMLTRPNGAGRIGRRVSGLVLALLMAFVGSARADRVRTDAICSRANSVKTESVLTGLWGPSAVGAV